MSISKILYKSFYWKLFQFLISLITTITLARILKPAISAEFYSLLYLFSLMSVFFNMGLDIGLNYFISKKELDPKYASVIIIQVILIALLISLPIIYFVYRPAFFTGFTKSQLLLFGGLQIAGGLFTTLSGAIFTAHHQNHLATKIAVFFSIALLGLILLMNNYNNPINLKPTIFYTWYIFIFLQGISLFVYGHYKYSSRNTPYNISSIPLKRMIGFSFFAFAINFIFYASSRLPIYILPYWVDANAVGNYVQAYKLLEYTGAVIAFIYFPVVAMVASEEGEKMKTVILWIIRVFNTLTVFLSIIVLLCGKVVFPLIFGPSFNSMYGIFVCLVPAIITSCASSFFTAYFFGKGYLKYNLISAGVLLFTLVVLFLPLVQYYGIKGAALALSAANIFSLMTDVYMFKRLHAINVYDMLFIKREDIYRR